MTLCGAQGCLLSGPQEPQPAGPERATETGSARRPKVSHRALACSSESSRRRAPPRSARRCCCGAGGCGGLLGTAPHGPGTRGAAKAHESGQRLLSRERHRDPFPGAGGSVPAAGAGPATAQGAASSGAPGWHCSCRRFAARPGVRGCSRDVRHSQGGRSWDVPRAGRGDTERRVAALFEVQIPSSVELCREDCFGLELGFGARQLESHAPSLAEDASLM